MIPFHRNTPTSMSSAGCSYHSHQQNRRSGGGAGFQIAVRLLGILEGIFLVDRDLDLAARNDVEGLGRELEQVLAFGGVVVEGRPRRKQRALDLKQIDIEDIDRPGRAAEAYEHAKRTQAVE